MKNFILGYIFGGSLVAYYFLYRLRGVQNEKVIIDI